MILKFFERAESGLEHLARFLAAISALAAACITGIICVSVIMRRLVNSPLFYAEELVGLLLAITLFLALPLVTMRGEHIRVTLLASQLNQRGRTYLGFIGGLVGLAFLGWLIWESIEWMSFAIRLNLKTEATSIPLVPWMAVVPFSLSVTALIIFIQLCTSLVRLKNDGQTSQRGSQGLLKSSRDKSS